MQIGCQCKNFRPYGSAWHLLRFLGYHRDELNAGVSRATGAKVSGWLDFPYAVGSGTQSHASPAGLDSEWEGLEFLRNVNPGVLSEWESTWPQSGSQQCWDAVARLESPDGQMEWLLVEAKAHLGEFDSACAASSNGGLSQIQSNLDALKTKLGVPLAHDWLKPFYQCANRLFVLDFLLSHDVPARLLHVCFLGDAHPGKQCPTSEQEWETKFDEIYRHLGLNPSMGLLKFVHRLYLPIHP